MPKEIVNDPVMKDFRIETSWGRNGSCVQVATVSTDSDRRTIAMLNEVFAQVGMPTVDFEQFHRLARKLRLLPVSLGWHVTITDRGEINELIRQLRRARDHAFGRDE